LRALLCSAPLALSVNCPCLPAGIAITFSCAVFKYSWVRLSAVRRSLSATIA
jgi:hypothetical protein